MIPSTKIQYNMPYPCYCCQMNQQSDREYPCVVCNENVGADEFDPMYADYFTPIMELR